MLHVWCSVLQCIAVCCSVLQCVAVAIEILHLALFGKCVVQCIAVRCSVLQCIAVYCSVVQKVHVGATILRRTPSSASKVSNLAHRLVCNNSISLQYSHLQIRWHRILRVFLKLANKPEFCP